MTLIILCPLAVGVLSLALAWLAWRDHRDTQPEPEQPADADICLWCCQDRLKCRCVEHGGEGGGA